MVEVAEGKAPVWVMSNPAEWALKKLGFIPETVIPDDFEVNEAVRRLSRRKDAAVNIGLRNAIQAGTMPEDVEAMALNLAKRRLLSKTLREMGAEAVAAKFDKLIAAYAQRAQKP